MRNLWLLNKIIINYFHISSLYLMCRYTVNEETIPGVGGKLEPGFDSPNIAKIMS